MSTSSELFDFEKALQELEAIVNKMEAGSLTLEESLVAFEAGIGLTKNCQQALDNAEQRVNTLIGDNPSLNPSLSKINQDDFDIDEDC